MKKIIYLAGPMLGFSTEEMNEWRVEVALGVIDKYATINPARREYSMHEDKFIVENDKQEIDLCDIIFVNHTIISDGTAMEILYAWERGKYIITVVSEEYSPWIKYHSDKIFDNIGAAVNFLNHDFLEGGDHASKLRNSRYAVEGAQDYQI